MAQPVLLGGWDYRYAVLQHQNRAVHLLQNHAVLQHLHQHLAVLQLLLQLLLQHLAVAQLLLLQLHAVVVQLLLLLLLQLLAVTVALLLEQLFMVKLLQATLVSTWLQAKHWFLEAFQLLVQLKAQATQKFLLQRQTLLATLLQLQRQMATPTSNSF